MTLHNTLFFKNPQNYLPGRVLRRGTSTLITEMTDNNYRTFSREQDVDINMSDESGNPTRITHIFIKGKNLEDYALTPIGGSGTGFTGRILPTSVLNYEGTASRTTVSGFQHDLYELPSAVTAASVRLRFTGANAQIHAAMLLNRGWHLNANAQFTQIDFNKVDRTGSLIQNPTGRTRRAASFAGSRFKWEGQYTCIFRDETLAAFHAWIEANLNFAFAQEFTRYPARVFPATFPAFRLPNGYLTLVKSNGEWTQFRVAER